MYSVENPVLKGFNPDPSIVRVGKDYYIATSTFEYFPGVQIHHSTDLVNWKVLNRPLDSLRLLDMAGCPDSCGVWAPCLSYSKGLFHLVYSNVKSFDNIIGNTPNFLTTASDIMGPWSDPIYLSNSGFDGSFFHDNDGRQYFLSMKIDKDQFFGGIILQEYSAEKKSLIGEEILLYEGSELGKTEGPHIYKRGNYYYLLLAEGGTEYGHAVSLARSKNLLGPYELHPQNPLITAANNDKHKLQKAGHACLVDTDDGRTFMTYLVGRPMTTRGRCMLGRESAIEEMVWAKDDWLYTKSKSSLPALEFSSEHPVVVDSDHTFYHFEQELSTDFQTLRTPIDSSWLFEEEGKLLIKGREEIGSHGHQSILLRRLTSVNAEVTFGFEVVEGDTGRVGLIFYYNALHFIYLSVELSAGESKLSILRADKGKAIEILKERTIISNEEIILRGRLDEGRLQFSFGNWDKNIQQIGPQLDATILSDDYVRDENNHYRPAFTGCMVGIHCGHKAVASLDFLEYNDF